MNKAIVTGANGFIGQNLVHCLAQKGVHVFAVVRDKDKAQNFAEAENVTPIICNMNEYSKLSEKLKCEEGFDCLFHLAWQGSAGKLRADWKLQMENVQFSMELAEVIPKISCKRFIAVGTVSEYIVDDILNSGYSSENMIYALAKAYTHRLLEIVSKKIKIDYIWAKFSNVYGKGNTSGNLISYTLNEFSAGHVPTFGPGEQPYNVDDIVSALYLLGEIEHHNANDFFLGNGECRKLKDYLYSLANIMDKEIEIGGRKDDGVIFNSEWFDITTLQKETGFIPKFTFENGIADMLKT